MTPTDDLSPEDQLAQGLAWHLQRWALALGASDQAAQAAAAAAQALSLATSSGHVCLALADLPAWLVAASRPAGPEAAPDPHLWQAPKNLPGQISDWQSLLLASQVVGTPQAPGSLPLILDAQGRLYLHRYFDLERRLARRLLRCQAPVAMAETAADHPAPASPPITTATGIQPAPFERSAALLALLFPPPARPAGSAVDWQQLACALALRGRLTVISGGPGTGKTTTVAKLLAALLAQQPQARVVLAAPTGKAAARLSQALRQRADTLDEATRRRLPSESFTVHRLLGWQPGGGGQDGNGGFIHHAGNPLALDVLVVDEASMLDLSLATRLLEAVPDHARIVLLGDKDQLAAVESGAVFAELSADPTLSPSCTQDLATLCGLPPAAIQPQPPLQPSPLHDSVVWLRQNFRFAAESGIGRLAADTVAGRSDQALAWLRAGQEPTLQWLDDAQPTPAPATLAAMHDGFAPYFAAVMAALAGGPVAALAEAFDQFRVLCAVREGARGVEAINASLTRQARALLAAQPGAALQAAIADARSPWYAGRPVMVLRNDAAQKLFNGDIGLALPDAGGRLWVHFAAADGGFRALAPQRLPAHQTAYAMTVHKAQGSEFGSVLLLLPAQRSRVLSRELLYTAITRARQRVLLAAGAPVLAAAMASGTQRHSGLLARLREESAGAQSPNVIEFADATRASVVAES